MELIDSPMRVAWKIYYTFAVIGVIAGTVSYGVLSFVGPTPFVWFFFPTLPLIVAFCLVISLPLTVIAFLVFRFLEARFGPRPERWWLVMGAASGLFFVAIALISSLSVGALANQAGRVFWFTLLVAGTVAGGRAAVVAQRPHRV